MPKVILGLVIAIIGVAGWPYEPPGRGDDSPQTPPDSSWIKMVPSQGFGAGLVFSCSPSGILGVTVIRYEETVPERAETVWGTGEQIWIEDSRTANCDCPSFNTLGPCRQGMVTPLQKP